MLLIQHRLNDMLNIRNDDVSPLDGYDSPLGVAEEVAFNVNTFYTPTLLFNCGAFKKMLSVEPIRLKSSTKGLFLLIR